MLCADLHETEVAGSYEGKFMQLATYDGAAFGNLVNGKAKATAAGTFTYVRFIDNDFPDATFAAHLHKLRCFEGAGGHYQGGTPGIVDDIEENWPIVTCSEGYCEGSAWSDWLLPSADLDAGLSIVVHDTPTDGNPKMLCTDIKARTNRNGINRGSKLTFLEGYIELQTGKYNVPCNPRRSKSYASS